MNADGAAVLQITDMSMSKFEADVGIFLSSVGKFTASFVLLVWGGWVGGVVVVACAGCAPCKSPLTDQGNMRRAARVTHRWLPRAC